MSDTPSRVLDFALDTFAAETLVGGLQAFACLVTRLWRTLPSTGCFVGRIARFLRKLVVLEGVRSRLCLALALDASREIRVALQALGLPHRRATSTVSPYSVPFVTVAWGAAPPRDTDSLSLSFFLSGVRAGGKRGRFFLSRIFLKNSLGSL